MSDFEVLPVGTEKFLKKLGYVRVGDDWVPEALVDLEFLNEVLEIPPRSADHCL